MKTLLNLLVPTFALFFAESKGGNIVIEAETTNGNPMVSKESAQALLKTASEEIEKREDSLDSFLAELPKAKANTVRKEAKAFLTELRESAGKALRAIVHLWNIRQELDEPQYVQFGRAMVAEGHVPAGTFYTFSKKIEVFESLKAEDGKTPILPDIARSAVMSYSNGDSIIVRRPLTKDEVKAFKLANPTLKAPKGTYEASKYFLRAVDVVPTPDKWTPDAADTYAARVIRLAAKLRGKDRSGTADRGDDGKIERFNNLVDKLEVAISGEPKEDGTGVKGMVVLKNKEDESAMLTECAEIIVQAVAKRLPLEASNLLWGSLKEIFEEIDEKATKASGKKAKAA